MFAFHLPANRWQAFLIHLALSAVIFLVLLYLIVFVWYPQPYFAADGGWQGIRIIAGVDLVLGPLLTLIVYQRHKRTLKLDLGIIALIQFTALVWGTWLVYEQRTTVVTFADGIFYSLPAKTAEMAGGKAITLMNNAERFPVYAVVRLPENPEELQKLKITSFSHGVPLYGFGDRYEPLSPATLPLVFAHRLDLGHASQDNPLIKEQLDAFLSGHGGVADDYAFLALQCRYQRLVLAMNRRDGAIVGTLDIDPDSLAGYRPAHPGKHRP